MGLSQEEAYEILELPYNSSYRAALKSYKRLSLFWFPDMHNFSPTSLESFQKISLAIMKLSCPDSDICFSLTVPDMLTLFQHVFFGGDTCSCCGNDEASCEKKDENSDRPDDKLQSKVRPDDKLQDKDKPDVKLQNKDKPDDKLQNKDKPDEKLQNTDHQPASVTNQNVTHDERHIIMKKTRKAEKRKAEKKRKKARKKLEKISRNQKDDQVDVISTSSKNSTEKRIVDNREALSDEHMKQNKLSEHNNCDCYDDLYGYCGTSSDDDYYDESDYAYLGSDDDCVDSDDAFDKNSFVSCLVQKIGATVAKEADKNALSLILEEERNKKRLEQRKSQKKKKKEKKRQEQASEVKKQNEDIGGKVITETESNGINDKENIYDSEEDIDLSSAFVAMIAKKKKRQLNVQNLSKKNSEEKKCSNPVKITKENWSPNLGSKDFAIRGNNMANIGDFQTAASLFAEAIKLDASECRYYGNRSLCYEKLGQHNRALKDAEIAINLSPKWAKGHFRKGKALVGLKEYVAAENCFREVLLLDPSCSDANTEILNSRVLQVMEKGFSKEQAQKAVERSDSVLSALDLLVSVDLPKVQMNTEVDVFISDYESDGDWMISSSNSRPDAKCAEKPGQHNLGGQTALWVGSVQPETTEELLFFIFSRYGTIKNVKKIPEKHCAFVNYNDRTGAQKAMDALQGMELHGAKLVLGFPKKAAETAQEECYFWRTTGCAYPNSCRFKHVKANKGIDKKMP